MLPDTVDRKMSDLFGYFRERIQNFCIDEKMLKALCFREKLEVFCKNNSSEKLETIGKYLISVENIGPKSQELFVQIFLSMTVNGRLLVSKITSSATKELHCLEEKKHESSGINNSFCEKNLYVGSGDTGYFIKVMEKSIEDKQLNTIYIPYSGTMFLSDGCSILLMRYLAMTNFCGTLCFDAITMEGTMVKCAYECSSVYMKINNADIEVFEIVQKFYNNDTVNSTIKAVLSKQGNLLSIHFIDSPYMIKISPRVDYSTRCQKPIILPLREEWKEDFEMFTEHFYKTILEEDRTKKYLLLHCEIKELMSDYIQSLLCKKPDDVLTSTIDHFKMLISDEI